MVQLEIARSLDNSSQHLIILPTEHCNFRCTYCYEDFSVGRMKPEVVRGIKALIEKRSPDLKRLQLGWFGGEPLLAKNVLMDIMGFANTLAALHKFDLKASITTNGYLLSTDTFNQLCSANVFTYQITLDGPQSIHDKTRIRVDGAGTFDTVFRNIESIHQSDKPVKIVLRVHYSEENYLFLPELLSKLSKICDEDERFFVHLKSIENLGGNVARDFATFSPNRRAELHEKLCGFLPQRSVIKLTGYMCYASCANSMVIRADGSIAKCTVAFSSPDNYLGQIKEGGEIDIDQNKVAYWIRGIFSGNQSELSCPALDYTTEPIE